MPTGHPLPMVPLQSSSVLVKQWSTAAGITLETQLGGAPALQTTVPMAHAPGFPVEHGAPHPRSALTPPPSVVVSPSMIAPPSVGGEAPSEGEAPSGGE